MRRVCDQKTSGSNHAQVSVVWTYTSVEKLSMVCMHLKDPLESFDKRRGLSPSSGLLSVTDTSITMTKGDVKLYLINQS